METAGLRNARGTNLIRPRCTRAPSPEGKAVCSECGGFAQRPGGAPHPPSLLSGAFPRGERLHAQKAAGSRNARGTHLIRPRCTRAPSPEGSGCMPRKRQVRATPGGRTSSALVALGHLPLRGRLYAPNTADSRNARGTNLIRFAAPSNLPLRGRPHPLVRRVHATPGNQPHPILLKSVTCPRGEACMPWNRRACATRPHRNAPFNPPKEPQKTAPPRKERAG